MGSRLPCSAAGSTATTRPPTATSQAGSCERGLIVSEYEAGVEPAPWRFPARNRIIAGLCTATVVVEARERSGALITADFALEDGREVMVVPGEITSAVSAGSNALLRLGATPVTAAADVLEAYGIERVVDPPEPPGGLAGSAARAPCRGPCEHRRAGSLVRYRSRRGRRSPDRARARRPDQRRRRRLPGDDLEVRR